jgi:hypothetical protein
MAFTSAGLTNGGNTDHFTFEYDDPLPASAGVVRTNSVMQSCEADWALLTSWFPGVEFVYHFPIPVQISSAPTAGSASWSAKSQFERITSPGAPTVTINLPNGDPAINVRFLIVAEVSEMWMESQAQGWYEPESFFSSSDEGSMGEGLSRFLAVQLLVENGLPPVLPWPNARVARRWLNGSRGDFVHTDPDDPSADETTGCTTLYMYYLHDHLKHGIPPIIASGGSNLTQVFHNLTGETDGWTPFINVVNSYYPTGFTYNPAGDNLFPVSEMIQWFSPNQITCGYTESTSIVIDKPAMAEVNITLTSDDPSVVSVLSVMTIPVGGTSKSVTFSAPPVAGPFPTKSVNVHATYAGKALTVLAQVVPPKVVSLTLSPDTVKCGETALATVTLDRASLLGPVVVALSSEAPGFANPDKPTLTIPQNKTTGTFHVRTVDFDIPIKTSKAVIWAQYGDSAATALLTIKSRVIAGILNSISVIPTTVNAGDTANGTVTLVEAVPVDTHVGLVALEPGSGHFPAGGTPSSVASVPPSVTIKAGETVGYFTVSTSVLPPHTRRRATILAGAVVQKWAQLVVEG